MSTTNLENVDPGTRHSNEAQCTRMRVCSRPRSHTRHTPRSNPVNNYVDSPVRISVHTSTPFLPRPHTPPRQTRSTRSSTSRTRRPCSASPPPAGSSPRGTRTRRGACRTRRAFDWSSATYNPELPTARRGAADGEGGERSLRPNGGRNAESRAPGARGDDEYTNKWRECLGA